jgi:hypothetical protein
MSGKEKSAGMLAVFRASLTQPSGILAGIDKSLDLSNEA